MQSDDNKRPEDDIENGPEDGPKDEADQQLENGAADAPQDVPQDTPEEAAQEPNLEDRLAAANDQLLRSLAELENTRKRAERDRAEALKYGAMSFARDMLGVADNFQRALKAVDDIEEEVPEAMRGLLDGIAATQRDLLAALARHKVTPLDPMGEKFDPNMHEALFEAPGTGQESGTIIEVIETGYMMEARLLRPAKVGIAKD
ncbi:MAG: nucleotide exchange factor GrpE [PS1 clade bacterium]|nr:nucleotide exchange factor GrpE [PS1 clade bacterium]MBL6783647.1 nucleotide exchange factor GrpE [PS1 clade bacterium]